VATIRARFDAVNLVTADVPASRAFYERLGLSFRNSHEPVWERHHVSTGSGAGGGAAEVDLDLDSASFAGQWNRGWPGGTGVVLGFRVDTREAVDQLVTELGTAGAPVQQEPYDAFWGARYAVVADPDGNAVGIMSPVDDDHRSTPPSPE